MTTTADAVPVRDSGRWRIWTAGLIVAIGAAIATAHGLYRVALAATVPGPIAWLYPLITDGLALVAYASTTRLRAGGRRYAWAVVVLAAGLSGLAQASHLAIGVATAPVQLRFGVGAWPAIAAAITAHLLYLLAARPTVVQPGAAERLPIGRLDGVVQGDVGHRRVVRPDVGQLDAAVQPAASNRSTGRHLPGPVGQLDAAVQRPHVGQPRPPRPSTGPGVPDKSRPGRDGDLSRTAATPFPAGSPLRPGAQDDRAVVQPRHAVQPLSVQPEQPDVGHSAAVQPDAVQPVQPETVVRPTVGRAGHPDPAPAGDARPVGQPVGHPTVPLDDEAPIDRALAAARAHRATHGGLPTVSQLAGLADVARGTAATALKQLRDQPAGERHGLAIVRADGGEPTGISR